MFISQEVVRLTGYPCTVAYPTHTLKQKNHEKGENDEIVNDKLIWKTVRILTIGCIHFKYFVKILVHRDLQWPIKDLCSNDAIQCNPHPRCNKNVIYPQPHPSPVLTWHWFGDHFRPPTSIWRLFYWGTTPATSAS